MSAKHVATSSLVVAALVVGCGQPKQVKPDTGFEDSGEDIAAEEEKEIEPAAKMPDEMSADEKKAGCCEQCAKGLAKDRTGQPAEQIPCADFTADLEEWCLGFFRKHEMKASECKAMVKSAEGDAATPPGADAPGSAAVPPAPPPAGG